MEIPTMATHPDDLNEPIRDVCEAITSINRDLGTMPGSQVGSPWHADRVAERERLHAELVALDAEQDALLADRPDVARMMPRRGHPVAECLLA
jgi:hypothetical protein